MSVPLNDLPEILNVHSLRNEPVYDSFDAAVDATKRSGRHRDAEGVTEIVKQRRILGIVPEQDRVTFHLSGGIRLRYFIDIDRVSCEAIGAENQPDQSGVASVSPLTLRFGEDGEAIVWDRRQVLSPLIGCDVLFVSLLTTWAFLDVRAVPGWDLDDCLMFCAEQVVETGEMLLYYSVA